MKIYLIGRSQDNDIVIDDPNVSKHHAQLHIDGDRIAINDLNSTNGTSINGVKIQGKRFLEPYDVVQLGTAYLKWQNYIPEKPAAAAPVPAPAPIAPQVIETRTVIKEIREVPVKNESSWLARTLVIGLILLAIPTIGYVILRSSGHSMEAMLHLANTIDLQVECSEVANLLIMSEVTAIVSNRSDRVHDNVTLKITGFDKFGSQIIEKIVNYDVAIGAQSALPKLVSLPAKVKSCRCEVINSNPR